MLIHDAGVVGHVAGECALAKALHAWLDWMISLLPKFMVHNGDNWM